MFNEIIINKSNLINNIRQVKLNNPNSLVCAMVKANAYGVGLKEVVKTAREYVDCFGVACLFEAKRVRRLTDLPILIVGALERKKPDNRFIYTCHSIDDIKFLTEYDLPIKIHIKINTGMNRYGFGDLKSFENALSLIKNSSLIFDGMFTHFATSDNLVQVQYNRMKKFINLARQKGFNPTVHVDNSETNILYNHHQDMVRIGFDLYFSSRNGFKQIVEIKSKIVQINNVKKGVLVGYSNRYIAPKAKRVAIVPIGYADGFDLNYIGFKINVYGVECEVLNVCMDCFMLDVTKTNLKKGDEIFILNKFNSFSNYADYINTIDYEIMCKFSSIRASRKII